MKPRTIDFLFLSSFVFLGIGIYMIYNFYNKYDSSNDMVDFSYQVQNKILDIESEFRSMVSDQRSYLLSEDKEYLVKYTEGKVIVKKLTNELAVLIKDNPVQTKNVKSLAINLDRRINSLNEEVVLMGKRFFSDRQIKKHIAASSKDSEGFIEEIKKMNAVSNELMKSRIASQVDGEEKIPILFSLITLLSISIIAFTYFKLKSVLNEQRNLLFHKRRLVKSVTKANEELQHYAYVSSHDLQEPLRKIRIFADLSKEAIKNKDEEKLDKYLKKIDASSNVAIDLAKRLMNHAQLNEEDDELMSSSISDIFKKVATEKKASIEPEIVLNFSVDKTPRLSIYPKKIDMLFRNLLDNAIKFKKEDTPEVKVKLTYEGLKDQFHKIIISDNGAGFDQENAEKVFGLFNDLKLHKNSSKKSFGLNACRKIMENHNGEIIAESEPLVGTKIICLFPIED